MIKTIYKLLFVLITIVIVSVFIGFNQIFDFDTNSLPKIHFYRWRSIPFKHKETTFMSYVSNDPNIDHIYLQKIRAKARGGASEDYTKHNFTIELENKHQLAGLENEDDWILGASFIDKSFTRHKLSFDLFKLFNDEHEVPDCEFVEVYINFKYHGLYILMERMDSKRLELNKRDSAACIFKEPPVFVDPKIKVNSNPYKGNDFYHQKFPDLPINNKSQEIKELREFINYAHDSLFDNDITLFFDLDDIIDWHILLLITHNSDAVVKGFYLYKKESGRPFKLALWDYNNSFGRDNDNERHFPGIINWEKNMLLNRLVNSNTQGYKDRLKNRFVELVESDILTAENLAFMVDENHRKLKGFVKKNEKRWPVDATPFYDDDDFEDEIIFINKWIPVQLKVVSEYLNKL